MRNGVGTEEKQRLLKAREHLAEAQAKVDELEDKLFQKSLIIPMSDEEMVDLLVQMFEAGACYHSGTVPGSTGGTAFDDDELLALVNVVRRMWLNKIQVGVPVLGLADRLKIASGEERGEQ